MVPIQRHIELMMESMQESENSVPEDSGIHPKVGAVLADLSGKIIERSHRGESGNGDHCEYILIKKASDRGIDFSNTTLYVTLEPCTSRGPGKIPCAQRIADSGIGKVYIGMLDPNPLICGRGETFLRSHTTVERFPSELVKEIEEASGDFVKMYRSELLPDSSLYISKQITDLMVETLRRDGLIIKDLPSDWDLVIDDIVHYCQSSQSDKKAPRDYYHSVMQARNKAYDKKYFNYSYDNDARGLGDYWQEEFREILDSVNINEISKYTVINVGSGNGLEAKALFPNVKDLILVDIGLKSLERARSLLPHAEIFQNGAEDMRDIRTESQEIYISLRTYQSSFFDINKSLREAHRVLKPNGVIMISVANGFVGEGNSLIPGLVIPKTKFVDRNRPFEVADRIRRQLSLLRFDNVGLRTGRAEIYIYGRRL